LIASTPANWFSFDKPGQQRIARACNDYGARMIVDHPGRFGLFASLPLPDIDASLKEVEFALDTLGAKGFIVFTSYEGRYLGDEHFNPLFEELGVAAAP